MTQSGTKKISALTGATVLSLLLTSCGGSSPGGQDANSVTFGVIATTSGPYAEIGENIVEGFKLGVKHAQERGIASDYDVDIEVKDEQADAQASSQAARDFFSNDVNLLAGMFTTPACTSVANLAEQAGGVLVGSVCAGNDMSGAYTGKAPYSRTFTVSSRDEMMSKALGITLAERSPEITDYNVFGFDYAWGHETWQTFHSAMGDNGVDVKVNQEYWVPLGDTNFRSQVSAMSRGLGKPDKSAVFLSTFGSGSAAFLQQAEAFNIEGNVEFFVSAGGYYPVARQLNGAAPEMWNSYDYNYAAHDSEVNDAFIKGIEEKLDHKPMGWTYEGYNSALAYMTAIDNAGSADPDAVRDALESVEFEGPMGEVSMDPQTHQLQVPLVVAHTIGNPDAPEGVEILETVIVPAEEVLP